MLKHYLATRQPLSAQAVTDVSLGMMYLFNFDQRHCGEFFLHPLKRSSSPVIISLRIVASKELCEPKNDPEEPFAEFSYVQRHVVNV